ncbi:hypothetical protein LFT45_09620 [Arthrobacter sp. FW305-BF8]|uniref:hypothetical protein n=1 Tax=Arthrobacter sp. FW305-BF8 TaxID=2879617 RepID=UPI001F45B7F8|nr:hypothetical protein [Arthrobacter sp. FW305-BF8]UKA56139.1 hypothetical protein LFT45_09620 [Arthrobacter sp. FW305-BF8]
MTFVERQPSAWFAYQCSGKVVHRIPAKPAAEVLFISNYGNGWRRWSAQGVALILKTRANLIPPQPPAA